MVNVTGNSGAINVSYTYDGLGRLVTRTDNVAGTTTVYYYAGQQLLQSEQYSPSPTGGGAGGEGSFADGTTCTTVQYVWSARYVDSPIETDSTVWTYSTADGGSWTAGAPDRLYYLTDANNNVTAVVQYVVGAGQWQVVERYSYNAYGNVTVYNSGWTETGNTSAVGNPILFAGMRQDPATGMCYDRDRWYDPSTGGFSSTDPARSDANLYIYCGDDPTDYTDPSGMQDAQSGGTSSGSGQGVPNVPTTTCGPAQPSAYPGTVPAGASSLPVAAISLDSADWL